MGWERMKTTFIELIMFDKQVHFSVMIPVNRLLNGIQSLANSVRC